MAEWVDIRKDSRHVAREREKARSLRKSVWWQRQVQAGVCHYCGKHVGPEALTMDHVVPVARGGTSAKGNVVPACDACNKSKKFLTPAEQILADLERESLGSEGV
ncbi:MAG: HNH endonuclease signature motif containing protein [Kiritimatiellae bacterium]|nr:HNH endonuclease signature motif containing protein [Kiritimatiellia bacterium]